MRKWISAATKDDLLLTEVRAEDKSGYASYDTVHRVSQAYVLRLHINFVTKVHEPKLYNGRGLNLTVRETRSMHAAPSTKRQEALITCRYLFLFLFLSLSQFLTYIAARGIPSSMDGR